MTNKPIAVHVNNKQQLIKRYPQLVTQLATFHHAECVTHAEGYTGAQILSWNYCPFCGTEITLQSVDFKDLENENPV